MKRIDLNTNIEIENDDKDLYVQVNYRCFFSPTQAFYPMSVSGPIFKGYSLEDFKQSGKKDYEKDYLKVQIVDVFIDDEDADFLTNAQVSDTTQAPSSTDAGEQNK